MSDRRSQRRKAWAPMRVTLSARVTPVRYRQLRKALSPMPVTPGAMTAVLIWSLTWFQGLFVPLKSAMSPVPLTVRTPS